MTQTPLPTRLLPPRDYEDPSPPPQIEMDPLEDTFSLEDFPMGLCCSNVLRGVSWRQIGNSPFDLPLRGLPDLAAA